MVPQDNEFSNRTIYGVESAALRYTWAGFLFFVIVSSLIGDTAILIASIKYRAFKLHKIIIVIIQHIAVCDLMVSVVDVFPNFASLLANKQVFGDFLCYISPYPRFYLTVASVLLICTMTTSKLFTLKYPIRSRVISLKQMHLICTVCWVVSFIVPVIFICIDWHDVYFSFRIYQCSYGYSADVYRKLKPILVALFIFLPTCVVVTTTVLVLIIAKRVASRNRGSLKWQGITTTVLTATIYCVSVLPVFLYAAGEGKVGGEKSSSFFHTYFYRIANLFLSLNTISNFYIYSLTVDSFRRFVRSPSHYRHSVNSSDIIRHGETLFL